MKFAKTLNDRMVPEWRSEYVEYKQGKKRIKAATNNLRNSSNSPAISSLRRSVTNSTAPAGRTPALNAEARNNSNAGFSPCRKTLSKTSKTGTSPVPPTAGKAHTTPNLAVPSTPGRADATPNPAVERSPLHQAHRRRSSMNYGAMGISPPAGFTPSSRRRGSEVGHGGGPPSLLLPDPMQSLDEPSELHGRGPQLMRAPTRTSEDTSQIRRVQSEAATASSVGSRPFIHRVLSTFTGPKGTIITPGHDRNITALQADAEKEFLQWAVGELEKCEKFYAEREAEVVRRFDEMGEQLELMRKSWMTEKHGTPFEEDDAEDVPENGDVSSPDTGEGSSNGGAANLRKKKRAAWKYLADTVGEFARPEPTIGKVNDMSTSVPRRSGAISQDYVRRAPQRKPVNAPNHRVAKRKLKKAYIEYYHGLEMLKSYVSINREGFRKITKKFDKASGLRMSKQFMMEYVDGSYFGGATNKLDDLLNETEDLFAKYFERGNRKEASLRLRSRENRSAYYDSVWRSGLCIGAGAIIALYGLYMGIRKERDHSNPELSTRTSYCLQIWGGAALIHLQALLFAINLRFWTKNKINYAFIFEFDTRHMLPYWQYLEIPAVLSLILAVCFWFSMYDFWPDGLDMIYYPVIYIGVILVLLLNPFKIFYYHSRRWFLRTMWRLFFSGLYPVEFKDFWTGDILCSQTYALGNIELFFCLYAHSWNDPPQCNSSHSRLLGFFQTLPGIWRLLQCFKRYKSSKMWFPHLVNGGKYTFTILYYMTLSIYRMDKSNVGAKSAFIVCALINALYTTFWDLGMDWSLMNPYSKNPFLRDTLGFKSPYPYYLAMIIDPIIRFEWIFYVIFANDLQHSALLSFLLGLAEVLRRFVWCFFRMENEHVGNVGAHRAYRDLPLPYHFEETQPLDKPFDGPVGTVPEEETDVRKDTGISTAAEAELENMEGFRQRLEQGRPSPIVRTMTRVGRSMRAAHLQDYERRRGRMGADDVADDGDSSEETDEELDVDEVI